MSKATRQLLGQRIRKLRKENGLTQERLALMVNIQQSYLSRLEAGDRNPSFDLLVKIADALGMTLSELFKDIA